MAGAGVGGARLMMDLRLSIGCPQADSFLSGGFLVWSGVHEYFFKSSRKRDIASELLLACSGDKLDVVPTIHLV